MLGIFVTSSILEIRLVSNTDFYFSVLSSPVSIAHLRTRVFSIIFSFHLTILMRPHQCHSFLCDKTKKVTLFYCQSVVLLNFLLLPNLFSKNEKKIRNFNFDLTSDSGIIQNSELSTTAGATPVYSFRVSIYDFFFVYSVLSFKESHFCLLLSLKCLRETQYLRKRMNV